VSKLFTQEEILKAVKDESLIEGGTPDCVEGNKYDLRLGKNILKAYFKRPINVDDLIGSDCAQLFVEPGEMVFVLSEERIKLPHNMKAELSHKRKLSHAGVLVVGGFCIDPKYQGRLLFGIYNFSSSSFPLQPGKKIIAAQFYQLSESEISPHSPTPKPVDDFPDDLVRLMDTYKPASMESLKKMIEDISGEVKVLRNELHDKEDWFKRFQEKLEKTHDIATQNSAAITEMSKNLEKEVANRSSVEKEFRQDMKKILRSTTRTSALLSVLVSIVSAVTASLIVGFILKSLLTQ
jgi:deoxycytidine triphosphate deaminase